MTLAGNNTYSGGTTLNNGVLALNTPSGNSTPLGTGALTINGGAINRTATGALTNTANNPITLGSDFAWGVVNVNGNGVHLGTGKVDLGTGPRTITLAANNSVVLTIGGAITNTGSLIITTNSSATKVDAILALAGANTFSGGVTLDGGTLRINSSTALGAAAGTFTINAGTIDNGTAAAITLANNNPITINGDFTFTGTSALNLGTGAVALGTAAGTTRKLTVNGDVLTIGGVTSDGTTANSLTVAGNNDLVLKGNNTYSGGTTIVGGGVRPGHNNAFGTGDITISTGGGFSGSGTDVILPNKLILNATGVGNQLSSGITFTNTWSGTGGYSFNGFRDGFLGLSGDNSGWSGNMTFAGSSQLQLGHTNALGTGILNTGSGGITGLNLPSIKATADLSAGNGVANNITNTTAGTVFYLDNNLKLSGTISGLGSIRIGNGSTATLTLTGNNDYTGFNNIQAGTLSVASLGNGGVASPLGATSNAANYLIIGGAATGSSGTLQYTGAGETSDRLFTIGSASATNFASSGGINGVALGETVVSRIDASGTGPLVFGNTGNLNVGNATNTVLELTGSNTGLNTLAAVIGDSTDGNVKTTDADSVITSNANGNPNRQVIVADTTGIQVGDVVSGTGIPVGAVVTAVLGPTRVAISAGATVTSSTTVLTFTPPNIAGNKTSLVKSGVGTWVLSGANTYSGGTTISSGILALSGAGTLGSGNLTIASSGTLAMGSTPLTLVSGQSFTNRGTFGGGLVIGSGALATGGGRYQTVTNMAGGTLTPGVGGDTNYFADLTLNGDSTNLFWLGSTATHDMSVVTNSLSYGGLTPTDAPVLQLDLSSWSGGSYGDQVVLYDDTFAGPSGWDGTNQLFRLFDTGSFNGTLLTNGIVFTVANGNGGTFKINYDLEGAGGPGNDILLTVIPEPASINLLAMLGAAYFMRRRIHRKKSRWNV